jgi:hypothetical protein
MVACGKVRDSRAINSTVAIADEFYGGAGGVGEWAAEGISPCGCFGADGAIIIEWTFYVSGEGAGTDYQSAIVCKVACGTSILFIQSNYRIITKGD